MDGACLVAMAKVAPSIDAEVSQGERKRERERGSLRGEKGKEEREIEGHVTDARGKENRETEEDR